MTWVWVMAAVWVVLLALVYVYNLEKALYELEHVNKQLRKDLDDLCNAHIDLADATVGKGYRSNPPRKHMPFVSLKHGI